MKMIIMGSGTSFGVPVIGCQCRVCKSEDKRDNRYRCSAYVTDRDEKVDIVIDTGPEFRLQALRCGIKKIDSVLITHSHADHIYGMDDLRIFSHTRAPDPHPSKKNTESERGMPIYANTKTVEDIKYRFDYVFLPTKEGGGKPKFELHNCDDYGAENPIVIGNIQIVPVPIMHGSLRASGYLLSEIKNGEKHSIAYLTDCNYVSEESISLIKEACGVLDCLVIDALRERPHSTHFSFKEALSVAEKLKPVHTYFTHMTHDNSHVDVQNYINAVLNEYPDLEKIVKTGGCVEPSYDGMEIVI